MAQGGRADNPAHFDLIAGARCTEAHVRLTAQTAAGAQYDGEIRDLDWLDAMAGFKGRAPLESRLLVCGAF